MPLTARELLEAADRLSPTDRHWLSQQLLHPPGDGSTEAEIEAAWEEEIGQRLNEIDSGAVEMVPWETVKREMQQMRSRLKQPA